MTVLNLLQLRAAILAADRVRVVTFRAARGTRPRRNSLPCGLRDLDRDDPRRDGDDAVADDHYSRGESAPDRSLRRDVAIADGRQRHDGPVDAHRDAGEAVSLALDHVEERADDDDQRQHRQQEDADLTAARAQRTQQHVGLRQVLGEFKNAEDAEQAQDADDQEVLAARDEQAQVGRDDRQQIDDAEEALRVGERAADADEPQEILNGEEHGEDPLSRIKKGTVLRSDASYALQQHGGDAQEDEPDQSDVEGPASRRLGLVDDFM